ncbi:MAG TPA: NUMOD3 domain-containing DNA-binding protein [Clostridiaceae bacterium]
MLENGLTIEYILDNNLDKEAYGFIYITMNIINNKKYIGQKMFDRNLKGYLGSGKILKQAVKKYGKENFSREIIAIADSKEELNTLEINFIKEHNAVNSDDYYNISFGGGSNAGLHFSEEHKRKISESHKGESNPMYGTHVSEKVKKQLSKLNTGRTHTKDALLKMSEWQIGRKLTEEHKLKLSIWHTGKIMSDETKYKLSEIGKGRIVSEETRQKLRESNSGENNPNFGVQRTDETKRKISETSKGSHKTEETKKRMSESKKGEKSYMYGKHHSEERKRKISESNKKITDDQVIEIREKYKSGTYTQRELADEYSTTKPLIGRIINYKGAYKISQ